MVNGPGSVILMGRVVLARSTSVSRTSIGVSRVILPTMRGTGLGWPVRSMAVPCRSVSMPPSAVATRLE